MTDNNLTVGDRVIGDPDSRFPIRGTITKITHVPEYPSGTVLYYVLTDELGTESLYVGSANLRQAADELQVRTRHP